MNDRIVHASGGDLAVELVRYDKAGKWYIEPRDKSLPRQHVNIDQAVQVAIYWWYNTNGSPQFDQPGGLQFNRLLRKAVK